jgi:hypothetical protein
MSGGVAMKKSFSNYTESGEWDFRDANTKEYTHSDLPTFEHLLDEYIFLALKDFLHQKSSIRICKNNHGS